METASITTSPMFLRRINNVLTAFVILLGLYIILSPILPRLLYPLTHRSNQAQAVVQVTDQSKKDTTPIPAATLIKIPRIGLTETIHTGDSIYELNKGAWLVPKTSAPDMQSNTVIVGHRFTYAGPAVFYFLDKVQLNDRITVDYKGKEYTYKVATIQEVTADKISVQDPTPKPQLTLYTCAPLLTAKNRLVITAPLVGVRS